MVRIDGRVLDSQTMQAIEWLRIEVWAPEGAAPLHIVHTGSDGEFRVVVDALRDAGEAAFKVFDDARPVPVTKAISRRHTANNACLLLLVDLRHSSAENTLTVGSLDELRKNESEAVRRLNALPNGAWLLFLDPLRALHDAGVDLTESAQKEFMHAFPFSSETTVAAYNATRGVSGPQPVTVRLQKLFNEEGA